MSPEQDKAEMRTKPAAAANPVAGQLAGASPFAGAGKPAGIVARARLRWEQARKLAAFCGPRATALAFANVALGAASFGVEAAFAFAMQFLLANMGLINLDAIKGLPGASYFSGPAGLWIFLAVGVLRSVLQGVASAARSLLNEEVRQQQRTRLIRWAFHSESISTPEVMLLINEFLGQASAAVQALVGFASSAVLCALLTISLAAISPALTLCVAAVAGVLVLYLLAMDRSIKRTAALSSSDSILVHHHISLNLRNLLLMRIYGTQDREESRSQEMIARFHRYNCAYARQVAVKTAVPQTAFVLLITAVSLLVSRGGWADAGIALPFLFLLVRALQTFADATGQLSSFHFVAPGFYKSVQWWADRSPDGIRNRKARRVKTEPAPIARPIGWRLENVGFAYRGAQRRALDGLTMEIAPGTAVVITGESGAGKSTLLDLILGNVAPTEGQIAAMVDGAALALNEDVADRIVRRVGYVGVESFLFDGTIRSNLEYGAARPYSDGEIRAALAKAECDFVEALPLGLEHRITEQGQGLSAGQKQRLGLARALLREPKALILDEATANLDEEMERRLVDTLQTLKGQMTIVAVTHRQGLLRIADATIRLKAPQDALRSEPAAMAPQLSH